MRLPLPGPMEGSFPDSPDPLLPLSSFEMGSPASGSGCLKPYGGEDEPYGGEEAIAESLCLRKVAWSRADESGCHSSESAPRRPSQDYAVKGEVQRTELLLGT
mmetsp:Transcript_117070/g.164590  ORF Transcript_117070/g.164590 Transcript_117070/m.164590 type:complete len:103 (-) Transcript_117070:28-336(-)